MKALIQRVKQASVTIDGKLFSEIGYGLLVFLGVEKGDNEANAQKLCEKIVKLRIFEDEMGKMNKSLKDVNGQALIVSQFTLCGDCSKGTRPSFDKSENPVIANKLYEYFIDKMMDFEIGCQTGKFGAMMDVSLINDGPVTFLIEK